MANNLKYLKNITGVTVLMILASCLNLSASSPEPSEIIQKVFEKYAGFESYSSDARIMKTIRSGGTENRFASEYRIDVQRPNKVSLRHLDGVFGRTIVSDGNYMWVYAPHFEQYSRVSAPPSFENVLMPELNSYKDFTTQQFAVFAFVTSPENFIEISEAGPARTEEIDGEVYYILNIRKKNQAVNLVVGKEDFYIKEIEISMSISENTHTGPVELHYVEIHDNAVFDHEINPVVFSFTPPGSARSAENLLRSQEPVFPFSGRYIGNYSFTDIAGSRQINISDFEGRIVLLFFVRPEEEESRIFIKEIAGEYEKLKNTELLIAARPEDAGELKKLIENTGNIFTGILDTEPYVSDSIGLRRMPAAVTVGLQGEIQQAYSGYFEALSSIIAEETALIIEGAALISGGMLHPGNFKGMLMQWNVPLNVADIKTNEMIYAISSGGRLYSIDFRGEVHTSMDIPGDYGRLEIVPLNGADDINFALYRHKGDRVHILDSYAKTVSVFSFPPSINTLKAADLTADGNFDLILGLSGMTGLSAVSKDGTVIFSSTRVHNVISVDLLDYGADSPGILAASAGGPLVIFTPGGDIKKVINTGIITTFAKSINGSILVSGTSRENEVLKLIDYDGNLKWELILGYGEVAAVSSAARHPFDTIFSCGTRDGRILVFDMEGNILAKGETGGTDIKTSWLVFEEAHTYLTASSRETGITSYIITGTAD